MPDRRCPDFGDSPNMSEISLAAQTLAGLRAIHVNASFTLAESGTAILVDRADPTGPNGARTFIIEIREVS
jgi:hypothetical protein